MGFLQGRLNAPMTGQSDLQGHVSDLQDTRDEADREIR